MISPPSTSGDVARWLLALTILYLVARLGIGLLRKSSVSLNIGFISDGVLFSGSALILAGVWWPATMEAIGDLTAYLILAGIGGVTASLGAAFREGSQRDGQKADAKKLNALLSDRRVTDLLRQIEQEPGRQE